MYKECKSESGVINSMLASTAMHTLRLPSDESNRCQNGVYLVSASSSSDCRCMAMAGFAEPSIGHFRNGPKRNKQHDEAISRMPSVYLYVSYQGL